MCDGDNKAGRGFHCNHSIFFIGITKKLTKIPYLCKGENSSENGENTSLALFLKHEIIKTYK